MSEVVENLLQPDLGLDELYAQAQESMALLEDRASAILEHLRAKNPELFEGVRFEMGDLKELERATGKIDTRYGGDPRQITDLVRGRFVADTPEQIRALQEAFTNDPEIQNIRDRFTDPVQGTGYRNISSETRLPNGLVAEIQIVQSDMLAVDSALHSRMEKIQEIQKNAAAEGRHTSKPERREIKAVQQEMRDITNAVAHDAGLEDMVDPEFRNRFSYQGQTVDGSALEYVAAEHGMDLSQAGEWSEVAEAKAPTKTLGVADDVGDASKLGKAGRLGANITGVGVAIGAGSFLLTKEAHAAQRDYAAELRDQGVLDEEAYQAYIELNENTEGALYGDLTISTVDPTGLSIVLTAFVEGKAWADFKDWSDQYAPHISEEHFQTLSMSMFPDNSVYTDMLWGLKDGLPNTAEGQPEYLHDAIKLKALYEEASEIGYSHKEGHLYGGSLQEVLDRAKEFGIDETGVKDPGEVLLSLRQAITQKLMDEIEGVFSDPENMDSVLNLVPTQDRLEYVRSLAASESNPEELAQNHPEIAAYVSAYDKSWTGWFLKEDDPLLESPELLNEYIKERTALNYADDPAVENPNHDFSVPGSTYAGNIPVEEVAAAGVPVASELMPASTQVSISPVQPSTQMSPENV